MSTMLVWLAGGPAMRYSDTWELIVNSWTNFVTFGIVFLPARAESELEAINLKLNEIVRSIGGAEDELIDVEKLSDDDMQRLEKTL